MHSLWKECVHDNTQLVSGDASSKLVKKKSEQ
jgi:hypothetical protein